MRRRACACWSTMGRGRPPRMTGYHPEDAAMSEHTSLTPRQQEIYNFICHRIDHRGVPPTIRDIGTAFDIKSPNGVMCHLKALEKKGFISREGKSARAIRPTNRRAVKHGL